MGGGVAQVYQELCKKHATFRERSENTDLAACNLPLSTAADALPESFLCKLHEAFHTSA